MEKTILSVKNLSKTFNQRNHSVDAVNDISFDLYKDQCLALVGESGCGKSTIASIIAGFTAPSGGCVMYHNTQLSFQNKSAQQQRSTMQMIFQNPLSSLAPRMSVLENMKEAVIYHEKWSNEKIESEAIRHLARMGLSKKYLNRYPHQLSGGECQRIAIAKALMRQPDLLICDEITSNLDVCVQAEIIRYLIELKQSGISILFITHDLSLTGQLCDYIAVMKNGKIIERNRTEEILNHPKEEYTQTLIKAAF